MLAGVDTGFFFAIEEEHPLALKVWDEKEIITSAIVLYELQKHLLKGDIYNGLSLRVVSEKRD